MYDENQAWLIEQYILERWKVLRLSAGDPDPIAVAHLARELVREFSKEDEPVEA